MLVILLGRVLQFLLLLAIMRVATTLLTPAEMGRLTLITTTTAFFAFFLVNPVGMFINRRLHSWQENGTVQTYLRLYWVYLAAVSFFAALVLTGLNETGWFDYQTSSAWLLPLVCGSLLFNTINQTVIPSINLLGASKPFLLLTNASVATGFLAATLLVMLFSPQAEYWLLGLLLGQTLFAWVGGRIFFAHLKSPASGGRVARIHARHLRTLFAFAWPIAISVGLGWVQSQGYRFMMGEQLGMEQLGLFFAGYGISAGLIAAFESILTTYLQPRLYRDANTLDSDLQLRSWQQYASVVIPALLLTGISIAALAPELTRIFLGASFQSASEFVVWGACAETARAMISTYTLKAHVGMQTRKLILPNLIGAALALLLSFWLMPLMGGAGVGVALSLSGMTILLTMHLSAGFAGSGKLGVKDILFALGLGCALFVLTTLFRQLLVTWAGLLGQAALVLLAGLLYIAAQYLVFYKHFEAIESR
jgi:O-antigen/teichoic acid export membrane protein